MTLLRKNAEYLSRAMISPFRPMTSQKCTDGSFAVCPSCMSSRTLASWTCATPMVAKSRPRDLLSSTGRRLVSRYSRKKSSTLTMYCRVCSISTSVPVTTAVACVSCSKKSTVMKVAGLGSPMTALSISTPSKRSSKMFSPAPRSAMSDSSALLASCVDPLTLDRTVLGPSSMCSMDPPLSNLRSWASSFCIFFCLRSSSFSCACTFLYRSSLILSARVFSSTSAALRSVH
mmetsp:Transcript_13606/g.53694  ORF Transcript_13606/g.53694 Transcript_13606/m.53694 type:complete len:231 (-) Transcript_13606:3941-4633(-)